MCGIIGITGEKAINVLNGLQRLEYRGYDSAGVAYDDDTFFTTEDIEDLPQANNANVSIAHTRWATHGKPSVENAHPHRDCNNEVFVVHNGIIENDEALKNHLSSHNFSSETDTEVIPHLIESHLASGKSYIESIKEAIHSIKGSYAFIVTFSGVDKIYAVRNDSPLWLGIDDNSYYLTSDIEGIIEWTDKIVRLGDDEVVTLEETSWSIESIDGSTVKREIEEVEMDATDITKGSYKHYTLKEIHEQPQALEQTLSGVNVNNVPNFNDFKEIEFVATGTSYHSSEYTASVLRSKGHNAHAFIPERFQTRNDALTVAVSQSGETADVKRELKNASKPRLLVTNTVKSSMEKHADYVSYTRAGPEIGVGATKTFTTQLTQLLLLSGVDREILELAPKNVTQSMDTDVSEINKSEDYIFIGGGRYKTLAKEAALKFMEWTYLPAISVGKDEMKHGPLALVDENTTVVMLSNPDSSETSLIREISSRGGKTIHVGQNVSNSSATKSVTLPNCPDEIAPILTAVWFQRFAYWAARNRDRNIDKPRNLAKSVTV